MKPQICLDAFALRFPRTGIVNYLYNVIQRLDRDSRFDVSILLQDMGFYDPELGEFARSLDHRLIGESPAEAHVRRLKGDLWQFPGLPLPIPGSTTRATGACDVYHCTDVYYWPSQRAKTNVITIYDLTGILFPETHEPINIEKETFKLKALDGFDRIVAISESTRNDIINYGGIQPDKVVTAHLGVDPIYDRGVFGDAAEVARALNFPEGRRYLLGVSTVEPRKNIIGVLEAFRTFAERNPADDDVILVLAGQYGWNNEALQAYLADYPLMNRIFFTGFVAQHLMPALYHHAAAFLYLSLYEGFGLPILEAMKSGATVICSNVSSMPEIIGDCGYTVPPRDKDACCHAIERVLGDPANARALAKRALARSARFSWDAHVETLLDVYGLGSTAKAAAPRLEDRSSPTLAVPADSAGAIGLAKDDQSAGRTSGVTAYQATVREWQAADRERDALTRSHIGFMAVKPHFHVLIESGPAALREATRRSCEAQLWTELSVIEGLDALVPHANDNGFLLRLPAGDLLHPLALYECACAINADPAVELIYFHEDRIDSAGQRHEPWFKPSWSPDTLEAVNYIGPGACYALGAVLDHARASHGQYDMTLRFTEQPRRIRLIDKVLLHRRGGLTVPPSAALVAQEIDALKGRLQRTARQATVRQVKPGCAAYTFDAGQLDAEPLVSIVIPTAARTVNVDGRPRDLIVECIRSIMERSTYRNYELVLVDNGDLDYDRLAFAKDIPLRSVTYHDRQVNISRKMNLGAAHARGEYLLLLNDDTEIISPDWIERQLFHFRKPHVGLVGGKLLYSDTTVQHVGVLVIHGHPDHVSRGQPRDADGYGYSGIAARNYSGATGAMTMLPAHLYQELGGYDELMPLTFNDIDLSLRVREAGYTVVVDPAVELFHYEGKSATNSYNLDDRDRFMARWAHDHTDPYYNVRYMRLASPDFSFFDNGRYL